jgi:hypothetical protein
MGKNCNGFNNRIGGNEKLAKALDIKEDLDIDCLLYCKHRLNVCHKDNKNNLKQMFQWELACTAISSHNVHKDKHTGQVQEEGNGAICFRECMGYIKKVGWDKAGLGRWSWILMGGTNGHNTRIITAYNPCKKQKRQLGHIIPATTPLLHHNKERPHLSARPFQKRSYQAAERMANGRG